MTATTTRQKFIGIPLQKAADGQSDGSVIVRGYFTSDNQDEVGDIITREATERAVPKYRQWGNIRFMHLPKPVARVLRIGTEDGLEWNEVEIKVIDPDAVFMVENGLLNALSVGILVDFKDFEPIDPNDPFGGVRILDYTLAEISLVDHPANYDAVLKRELPVEDTLRMVVRQYGFDAVAGSMAKFLEVKMEDQNPVTEEQPVDPTADDTSVEKSPPCRETEETEQDCIDRKVSEIMDEDPGMDRDQAFALAQEMCMSECPEDDPEAEDTGPDTNVSEAAEPEADKTPDEADAPTPDPSEELRQAVSDLRSLVAELGDAVQALKATVEARETDEQAAGEEPAPVPDADKGLDEEAAPSEVIPEEPGEPVNRKALFPADEQPKGEKAATPEPVDDLRAALTKYFNRK
jgi:hypothetical protein